MGMYDSFYDEDSECPKCHTRVREGWQTKRLESLLENWKKGDFFQYRRVIDNPDWKPGGRGLAGFVGMLKKLDEPIKTEPIIHNGKVPVHTTCESCDAGLEAYAKILDGRYVGIVEVDADGEPKELFIIKPEMTAKMLRDEFHRRLSHLQESCSHEKTKWAEKEWAPGHTYGTERVCLRCERILETAEEPSIDPNDPIFHIALGRRKPKDWGKGTETTSINHDKILYGPKPKSPRNRRKRVSPERKHRRNPRKTREKLRRKRPQIGAGPR